MQPTQPSQPSSAIAPDDLDPQLDPIDQEQEWYDEYKTKSYKDIALRMQQLKLGIDDHENKRKTLAREFDVLRLRVVPDRFAADDTTSMRIQGIGRLGLTADAYCTTIPGAKADLIEWLKSHKDYADIVKEDVNSSTLKSIVKDMAAEATTAVGEVDLEAALTGAAPPETDFDRIRKYVNYTPFTRASITRT